MKKKFTKRLLSWVMAAAMVISMLPISAMATGTGSDYVAQIGDTQYATLDEAVETAPEGSTITLLQDCELTKGFNKTLTFTGNGKIAINKQLTSNGEGWMCFGLGDPSRVLTFDGPGVEVEWNSEVGTAPWLMLSLSGTMNVTNGAKVTFTVDSGSTGSRNAIYMNDGSSINVTNGSSFTINGYGTAGKEGQGIQLDKTGKSTINVTNKSSFTIDGTNRGYVNSPVIYVKDSTFTVQNCTANGSNGGNFTAINSKITYQNNAGHGLSAGNVIIKNSDFVADNNGYYGIYASAGFSVDGTSKVTVTHNSYDGDFAGLKLTGGVTDGKVEKGAVVTITDNYCSGLSNNGKCVFEEGVDLTIMDNYNDKGNKSYGGGIYNSGASANLTLPSNAVIYNNHADTAGDDIFNNTTATITFGKVGSDWTLDDCTPNHLIDGWYIDESGRRWNAENTDEPYYVEEFKMNDEGSTTISGLHGLKAAHGMDPVDKTTYPSLDKKVMDDDEAWGTHVDASANQKVNFKLTSNVPEDLINFLNIPETEKPSITTFAAYDEFPVPEEDRGEYHLTFHDVMDDMLVDATEPVVTIDREGTANDDILSLEDNEYTYIADPEDGCDFHIVIDLVALYEAQVITDEDIEGVTPIVVTYDATLVGTVTAGTYTNTAWTTVDESKWESSHITVEVDTYGIDIFKYDQADSEKPLPGATFTLYSDETCTQTVATAVSGENGYASFDGLDVGTYYLKETEAPEGYVCSDTVVTIIIGEGGQQDAENIVNVRFANSPIPHTGGMGTTLFSIVGGALIATAGVIFVISRKKRARNAA